MKTDKRLPVSYKEFSKGPILSNLDSFIDREIEEAIKGKELFSTYAAWDFFGYIWWDSSTSNWSADVWVGRNIDEIISENFNEYFDEKVRSKFDGTFDTKFDGKFGGKYIASYQSENLEDLAYEINEIYGTSEKESFKRNNT